MLCTHRGLQKYCGVLGRNSTRCAIDDYLHCLIATPRNCLCCTVTHHVAAQFPRRVAFLAALTSGQAYWASFLCIKPSFQWTSPSMTKCNPFFPHGIVIVVSTYSSPNHTPRGIIFLAALYSSQHHTPHNNVFVATLYSSRHRNTRGIVILAATYYSRHRTTRGILLHSAIHSSRQRTSRGIVFLPTSYYSWHRTTCGIVLLAATYSLQQSTPRGILFFAASYSSLHRSPRSNVPYAASYSLPDRIHRRILLIVASYSSGYRSHSSIVSVSYFLRYRSSSQQRYWCLVQNIAVWLPCGILSLAWRHLLTRNCLFARHRLLTRHLHLLARHSLLTRPHPILVAMQNCYSVIRTSKLSERPLRGKKNPALCFTMST